MTLRSFGSGLVLHTHPMLKGCEPFFTLSCMKESARAIDYVSATYNSKHCWRLPLTKPLCPAPPVAIRNKVSVLAEAKPPLYTSVGSTSALVPMLTIETMERKRGMLKQNILDIHRLIVEVGMSGTSGTWRLNSFYNLDEVEIILLKLSQHSKLAMQICLYQVADNFM